MGLYAEAVQNTGYRNAKIRTLLDTVPAVFGPSGSDIDLRWVSPDGAVHASAATGGGPPTLPTARIDHCINARPWTTPRDPPGQPSTCSDETGSAASSTSTCRSREVQRSRHPED